jgi:hypothetical protein
MWSRRRSRCQWRQISHLAGACVLGMEGVRPPGPRSSSIQHLIAIFGVARNQESKEGLAQVGDFLPAHRPSLCGLGAWRLKHVSLHATFNRMQSACAALWAPAMRPAQAHSCSSSGSSSTSSGSTGLWLATGSQRSQPARRCGQLVVRAAGGREQQAGLNRMEAAVPREQRPVNELQQLKDTPLLAWVRSKGCEHPPRTRLEHVRRQQPAPPAAPPAPMPPPERCPLRAATPGAAPCALPHARSIAASHSTPVGHAGAALLRAAPGPAVRRRLPAAGRPHRGADL